MHLDAATRSRVRNPWVGAALVAGLVVVFLTVLTGAPQGSHALPHAAPAAWTDSSVPVTVVGDSLTSGYRTPGDPWTLPAQALLDSDGVPMTLTNASGPGSGYVAAGAGGNTFADYVRQGVTRRTRLVILFGSDNDLHDGKIAVGYASAVAATLDLVRSIAPAALVVVVGPPGTQQNPAASLTALDATLATVAADSGAMFVSTLGWFSGQRAGYLGPDGEHPDVAGEDYLADRFVALLRSLIPGRLSLTAHLA